MKYVVRAVFWMIVVVGVIFLPYVIGGVLERLIS